MADLDAVLEQLKLERKRAVDELKELERVISRLSKATAGRTLTRPGSGKSRLSAAARERIAAAQRARWAKARQASNK